MKLVKHKARVSILFLVAAAVAAGGAFAATPSFNGATEQTRAHKQTIQLREASATPVLTVIDVGEPGLSVGDHVVTTDKVLRPDGTQAGLMEQVCTIVRPGADLGAATFDCTGSFELDQGDITVQGPFVPNETVSTLAVTGGTGEFATARGQVMLATAADAITIELD